MALSSTMDINPGDIVGVLGTSLSQSNTVTPGVFFPIFKWYYNADLTLQARYSRTGGLGPGAVLVAGISDYRRAPAWICGAQIGATMVDMAAPGYFLNRVGRFSPSVLVLDAGPNDVVGVDDATFAARAATLAGVVTNPANYAAGAVTPRWIAWLSLMFRGSEQWTNFVQAPALGNTNIGNASIGGGGDLFLNAIYGVFFTPAYVGGTATIAGATNPSNNGTFQITGFIASNRVQLSGAGHVAENLDVAGKTLSIVSPQPDPDITAKNVLIQAQCAASGFNYVDARSLWLAEAPRKNPTNQGIGFYSWDGTHFTGPNGPQGNLGCEVVSRGFTNLLRYREV